MFKNPFSEEIKYDIDIQNGSPRKNEVMRKKGKNKLITGSFENDIKCLFDSEMINEFIEASP